MASVTDCPLVVDSLLHSVFVLDTVWLVAVFQTVITFTIPNFSASHSFSSGLPR